MRIRATRKTGVLAVLLLKSFAIPSVEAQNEPQKVGILLAERLITEHPDYQRAQETFASKMNEQVGPLQTKRNELLAAQQELADAPPTLDAAARAALVSNAEQLQTEVDRMTEDIRSDLNALQEELMLSIYDAVDAAVLSYVEENGFDLVLDASNPAVGVRFADDLVDITDAILERMALEPSDPAPEPALDLPLQE